MLATKVAHRFLIIAIVGAITLGALLGLRRVVLEWIVRGVPSDIEHWLRLSG
jgi:hypothetical protein